MEIVVEARMDPVRAWPLRQDGPFGGSVGPGEMEFADMLVLSRKKNETIHIGDEVTITVTEIRGDKVRIGIDAPAIQKILRGELLDRIARELNGGQAVDVETGKLVEILPTGDTSQNAPANAATDVEAVA